MTTTILGLLLSVSLLSTPGVKTAIFNQTSAAQIERIATDQNSFAVQNLTTVNVGVVNVHESDHNVAQIVVGGPGNFQASLTGSPVGVDINGQGLVQGVPTKIIIDQNTSVRATWTDDIIVIDQQATN